MVLVNAVYFKGNWAHQFDPENTRKEKFHLLNKETVDVDMMFIRRKFYAGFHEELDSYIVELPYKVPFHNTV